jgi:hypothetical protein
VSVMAIRGSVNLQSLPERRDASKYFHHVGVSCVVLTNLMR